MARFAPACALRRHCSPLFPYTTLFRSKKPRIFDNDSNYSFDATETEPPNTNSFFGPGGFAVWASDNAKQRVRGCITIASRSEEHTSELQSRRDPVCRLLLEKKNVAQRS